MGDHTKAYLTGFGTVMGASLLLAGINADQGLPYFAGAAAATGSMAWWVKRVYRTNLANSDSCCDCVLTVLWLCCGCAVAGL